MNDTPKQQEATHAPSVDNNKDVDQRDADPTSAPSSSKNGEFVDSADPHTNVLASTTATMQDDKEDPATESSESNPTAPVPPAEPPAGQEIQAEEVTAGVAAAAAAASAKRTRQAENTTATNGSATKTNGDSNTAPAAEASGQPPRKRVRRVGRIPVATGDEVPDSTVAPSAETNGGAAPTASEVAEAAELSTAAAAAAAAVEIGYNRVQTKHDEKWNAMFDKLIDYKEANNGSTMVPQCYHQNPRLGRWVHYQRVEYWIYQAGGKAKINSDRIARLNAIDFEWDPQRAQWNAMYERLQKFVDEHHHARVPKGYANDPELANWVRNQRLELSNMNRGKKSRMNKERLAKLNALGFQFNLTGDREAKKSPPPTATAAETANGAESEQKPPAASVPSGEITSAASSVSVKPDEEGAVVGDKKPSEGGEGTLSLSV